MGTGSASKLTESDLVMALWLFSLICLSAAVYALLLAVVLGD